jgi:hypothetical protein
MSAPFWIDQDFGSASLWDFLWLGGVLWPGICKIESVTKSRSIDEAKVPGSDGITLTDKGYNASKVKARIIIWEEHQWERLNKILPDFDPRRPGSSRTPLDIYHPTCVLLAIKSVYIHTIKVANPTGHIFNLDLDLIEWFPKTKPATSSKQPKGFDGTKKSGGDLSTSDFLVSPSGDTDKNL